MDVYVHHLINATGGKDPSLTIQKLGRGLRKSLDKQQLDYHDFMFSKNVNKFLADHSEARVNTIKKEGHTVVMEPEIIPFVKQKKIPVPRTKKAKPEIEGKEEKETPKVVKAKQIKVAA